MNSTGRAAAMRIGGRWLAAVALMLLAGGLGGCALFAWGMQIFNDPNKEPKVAQEYFRMENKSVAVLVAADERTLYEHPDAPAAICRAVSRRLAAEVPGVKPMNPEQVVQFMVENPYWNTTPRSEIFDRLKVERLVVVDVAEYSTHEPGDANIWRGNMVAGVGIGEAEARRPDDLAFHTSVQIVFPRKKPIGVLNSDDASIQLGLLTSFSKHVRSLVYGKD